jgi:hypothetical protein
MKKITLLAAAAFIAISFTSCKKDYTCTCTVPAQGSSPAETYTYQLKDVKKKDAKSACNSVGTIWILDGGSCDFK